MTVKKRLFLSNILMIAVPAAVTVLIGILCMGIIWIILMGGAGLKIEDKEDFDRICMVAAEMAEHNIEKGAELSYLESILDSNRMMLRISTEDEIFFEYGEKNEADEELMSAAAALDGQVTVTLDGRGLYAEKKRINNKDYTICLFASYYGKQSYSELKMIAALAGIVIVFGIFFSILFTNRFLTKFVFKRIEEPLDILTKGVREISGGNLEYRIEYGRRDEFLGICEDFNEMAERLKQSVEMQQKQEKSRKELVAGISHDLRSPLTSIRAYVEGLMDGIARTPEAQQKYLTIIKTKAEDLEHIISQLFLFSKMELEEYPENLSYFYLEEIIFKAVSAVEEEYAKKGINIHMELEPAEIYGDLTHLNRIIINIMENSLKYKDKDDGNIWIGLRRTEKGCRLIFADDGPGVREEALPHLFEVFYRSDPSRQNPDKGSGLGLAIVANAAGRMGAEVQAVNNEPRGLKIIVDFPSAPPHAAGEQKEATNNG